MILALICRVSGECTNATYLTAIPGYDLSHCMTICWSYDGCFYTTFNRHVKLCQLYETCSRAHVETALCPDCLTSSFQCHDKPSSEYKRIQ